jgi:hypothetical protein
MSALTFPSTRDSVARLPGYAWAVTADDRWLLAVVGSREEADDVINVARAWLPKEFAPLVARAITYEDCERIAETLPPPLLNPELWRRRA